MRYIATVPVVLIMCSFVSAQITLENNTFPVPQIPFSPKEYVCYHVSDPIDVDGKLNEKSWQQASWTDYFVDIEGGSKPAPIYHTRVKMLWDEKYFYVAADIQEPNLWATLHNRDTVIFRDNDFEVFIDPNGATQPYYETEINELGTVWDLLLREPYRDVAKAAVNAWDIKGLKVGVSLHGTLNDPSDIDSGWTVEIAFPWNVLGECAIGNVPPKDGDQWRVNFSRVEWRTKVENGRYVKISDPSTGRPLPEYNWVWSPQGVVNMHYPEMWGFVQFSTLVVGQGNERFEWNPVEDAKWAARQIYYAERQCFIEHGAFTDDLKKLSLKDPSLSGYSEQTKIYVTPDLFEATITTQDNKTLVHIEQDGKTWETKIQ
jgi:hypothetical protein